MLLNNLNRLIIIFGIVYLNQVISWSRNKQITWIRVFGYRIELLVLLILLGKIKRKNFILMCFDAPYFVTVWCMKIMDSDISVPVTTRYLFAIITYPHTSYRLLYIQRLPDHDFINVTISCILYRLPFFIAVHRLRFENFEVWCDILRRIIDEYYLAHVFAISIAKQPFLDLGSVGCWNWWVVNEVPESNRPVAGASHESCETIFSL